MVLRITKQRRQNRWTTVIAEGAIATDSVGLLERECARLFEEGRLLRLNLTDVDFVDRAGVEMLKRLLSQGVIVEEASLTVRGLLAPEEDSVQ